jgi:hypothetical protein
MLLLWDDPWINWTFDTDLQFILVLANNNNNCVCIHGGLGYFVMVSHGRGMLLDTQGRLLVSAPPLQNISCHSDRTCCGQRVQRAEVHAHRSLAHALKGSRTRRLTLGHSCPGLCARLQQQIVVLQQRLLAHRHEALQLRQLLESLCCQPPRHATVSSSVRRFTCARNLPSAPSHPKAASRSVQVANNALCRPAGRAVETAALAARPVNPPTCLGPHSRPRARAGRGCGVGTSPAVGERPGGWSESVR